MPRKHRRNKNTTDTPRHEHLALAAAPVRDIPDPLLGKRAWLWVLIPVVGVAVFANGFAGTLGLDGSGGDAMSLIRETSSGLGGVLTERGPLAVLTHTAGRSLGELARVGQHLLSLTIHILAGLALFGVVRRTLTLGQFRATVGEASPWIALAVALVWLVHPLQTESVTYLAQRSEALMGLFYLLVIYAVLRSADIRSSRWWQVAALSAFVLGMGCKGAMITAPFVVLLFDRTFLARSFGEALRRRRTFYVGVVVSIGAWITVLLTISSSVGIGAKSGTEASDVIKDNMSPAIYLMTQPGVILHYLRLVVLPTSLVFDYDWQPVRDPANAIGPILTIAALLVWTLWSVMRGRVLGFLAAAFFLLLMPTSSFLPMATPIAEHRMYLPLAVIVVFVVVGLYLILRDLTGHKQKAPRRTVAGTVLVIAAIALFSYGTILRNRDYVDAETMWSDVITKRPNNARAHAGLGLTALARGDDELADESLSLAVALDPNLAVAWDALGRLLVDHGLFAEGQTALNKAISLGVSSPDTYSQLGLAFKQAGEFEEALSAFSQAVWLDPELPEPYVHLGNIFFEFGDLNKALDYYDTAIELDPDYLMPKINKAAVYVEQNRLRDAMILYDIVLAADPDRESACNSRDYVLSLLSGEFDEENLDAIDSE